MKKLFLCIVILIPLLTGCRESEPISSVESQENYSTMAPTEETNKEVQPVETPCVYMPNPADSDFVRVRDYIPDVMEELKYATADNFTGAVIYNFQDIYLRYGTVKKLMGVQDELKVLGLGIKIWDGFRPISAQFTLWEILPDDTYVADPNKGFSNHSRGNAVDVTLVDSNGAELEMPTAFDDFSQKADRDYSEIPELPRANAELLQQIMEKHGLKGYYGEWWHFNDTVRYEPEHIFDPGLVSLWLVTDEPGSSLREKDNMEHILAVIPSGEMVTLLGYDGDRAYVSWHGQRGYLDATCLSSYSS